MQDDAGVVVCSRRPAEPLLLCGRWRRGPNLRSGRAWVGGATILKGVRIPLGFNEDFPALKPGCHVCLLNPSHPRQSCAGLLKKPVRASCAAIATPGDVKARSPTTAVARELSSNPETVASSPSLKYHHGEGTQRRLRRKRGRRPRDCVIAFVRAAGPRPTTGWTRPPPPPSDTAAVVVETEGQELR